MNRSSTLISILALAVVFVVGLGYLVVGVAHINPTRSEYSLTAIIDSSGGLLDTSPVMVRGYPSERCPRSTSRIRQLRSR